MKVYITHLYSRTFLQIYFMLGLGLGLKFLSSILRVRYGKYRRLRVHIFYI